MTSLSAISIPEPEADDPEDVVSALETAAIFGAKGDAVESVHWLRRAAESAGDCGRDMRAVELARVAAELTERAAQSNGARQSTEPEQSNGVGANGASSSAAALADAAAPPAQAGSSRHAAPLNGTRGAATSTPLPSRSSNGASVARSADKAGGGVSASEAAEAAQHRSLPPPRNSQLPKASDAPRQSEIPRASAEKSAVAPTSPVAARPSQVAGPSEAPSSPGAARPSRTPRLPSAPPVRRLSVAPAPSSTTAAEPASAKRQAVRVAVRVGLAVKNGKPESKYSFEVLEDGRDAPDGTHEALLVFVEPGDPLQSLD